MVIMDPLNPTTPPTAPADHASLGTLRGEFSLQRIGFRGWANRFIACVLGCAVGTTLLFVAFFLTRYEVQAPPGHRPHGREWEQILLAAAGGAVLLGACLAGAWPLLRPPCERLAVYDRTILYFRRAESESIPWETIRSIEERSIQESPPEPGQVETAVPPQREIISYVVHRAGGKDLVLDSRFADFERLGRLLCLIAQQHGVPWQRTDLLGAIAE